MASDSPTREIPPEGIDTPHGRLYPPLHEGLQILVLIGAFLGSLVMGWLVGMAPGDLSETAQTLAFVPFLLVLFLGYAAWVARLQALAFDLIGRSILRTLLLLILRRQKPKSIEDVIPSREKLQEMAVRAQRAGEAFGPMSWPIALGPPGYRMGDLSADPQAWQQSIQTLYSVVRFDLVPCLREQRCRVTESPAHARELGQRVFDEHAQFLRTHGDSARGMPVEDNYFLSRPLEEQRVIRTRWRKDLSAFPTWGIWSSSHWQKNLEELRGKLD